MVIKFVRSNRFSDLKRLVSSGFCNGFNGWVVGGLAADFVTDLTDGLLVDENSFFFDSNSFFLS
jgi:hypothetical protein